ncbi:hypothetical protein CRG98_016091 [Punica granatum]|uniref:Uncharacterized protein n=1 Tax=Punica granatum TaxID=22663 RepID=A0A2I0K4E8_PUNGR|nr:hypothetical protein CRG98_016091 [Punica granatum]
MLYLASGYKERVGEGFESWVTRLNSWKDVRVQGCSVRVSWVRGSAYAGVHGNNMGTGGQEGRQGAWAQRAGEVTDVGADKQKRACRLARASVTERQSARASNGCTVHPRARVEPETTKPTRNDEQTASN